MKAFVLTAGLGTRLKELTTNKPKALVVYQGKTLLENALKNLSAQGFKHIIINVHHFADQIEEFLIANNNFGLSIQISNERERLLDTGGAILHAKNLLSDADNFLIYNVDIQSNLKLDDLVQFHNDRKALASLAVNKRLTKRYLLFDKTMKLRAWQNSKTKETKGEFSENLFPFAFNGIHIISSQIFNLIEEKGAFSIIDLYLRLAKHHFISGFYSPEYQYKDLGKREIYS